MQPTPKTEKLRYFLALPVAPWVRDHLVRTCQTLRSIAPDARWSLPARYHVTLRYFGPLSPADRDLLETWLAEWSRTCPKMQISVRGLGVFEPDAPRVLYAKVQGPLGPLQQWLRHLGAELDRVFGPTWGPSPQVWVPHITLARARPRQGDPRLRHAALTLACDSAAQEVDQLLLLASDPAQTGGEYLQIRKFAL